MNVTLQAASIRRQFDAAVRSKDDLEEAVCVLDAKWQGLHAVRLGWTTETPACFTEIPRLVAAWTDGINSNVRH